MKGKEAGIKRKYIKAGITAAVCLSVFIAAAALSLSGALTSFEDSVYGLAAKTVSPAMTSAMKVITYAGSFAFLCGSAVLLIIIPYTRKRFGYPVSATALINIALNLILKNIFTRERPDVLRLAAESGYGFPSGHTQSSTAFFTAAAILLLANIKDLKISAPLFVLCILIPLLVGFSRIYLGVHRAGDVFAGWAAGAFTASAVNILWRLLDVKLSRYEKVHGFFFAKEACGP